MRRQLTAFNTRCRSAFPDFRWAGWNEVVGRYEIVSTSTAGKPVSQFFGQFRDPVTGKTIEPDPVTGLVPYRDLDPTAQEEVFRSMEATGLTNRHDGLGTQAKAQHAARVFNKRLWLQKVRERAENIAYLIKQVDLRRPWVKDHPRGKDPRATRIRRQSA